MRERQEVGLIRPSVIARILFGIPLGTFSRHGAGAPPCVRWIWHVTTGKINTVHVSCRGGGEKTAEEANRKRHLRFKSAQRFS